MIRLLLLMYVFVACTPTLKYIDDKELPVSAQVNSPELPVYINGALCKDTDDIPGLCSKRIKADEDLEITIDPIPYAYRFALGCSDSIKTSVSSDVLVNVQFKTTITKDKYQQAKSFTCIGEIHPKDRPNTVSAKFELRVKVVDPKHQAREKMQLYRDGNKKFLVLGANAFHARVCEQNKCTNYDKTTTVPVYDLSTLYAYSESYNMRYNYFNVKFFGVDYE